MPRGARSLLLDAIHSDLSLVVKDMRDVWKHAKVVFATVKEKH